MQHALFLHAADLGKFRGGLTSHPNLKCTSSSSPLHTQTTVAQQMAFRLFAAPTLAFAATGFYHHTTSRPLRCEAPTAQAGFGFPWGSYYRPKPMAPRPRNRSGYDPTVYRQISTGSFVGVALGLCVARFGKTLCLVIGAVMLIVEVCTRVGGAKGGRSTVKREWGDEGRRDWG
jgi:hypothetical protein